MQLPVIPLMRLWRVRENFNLTLLYFTLTFVLRTVKDCPLRHHGGLGLLLPLLMLLLLLLLLLLYSTTTTDAAAFLSDCC